jgi:hypothetical protein
MLFPLLGLVLAQASASPKCPSAETVLAALSVKADSWEAGCVRLDDGRPLIVAVDRGVWAEGNRVVVAAIAGESAARSRVEIPLSSPDSKKSAQATTAAEDWKVEIRPVQLGQGNHVRLGALVTHGDDYFLGQEIVVLLRIGPDLIAPLWTGLGDEFDRRFDSCEFDTRASFSLTSDGRLSRLRETKRSFRNAGVDAKLAGDLRKKCVAPRKRADFFPTR